MGRQESLDAAEAISVFDFGVDGLFVPMASGTLEGGGIHDPDEAVSRYVTPLDYARFRSVQPPSSWQRFDHTLQQILTELSAQGGLEELIAWAESIGLVARNANNKLDLVFGLDLALAHPGEFATGAGMAYSRYIENQANGYLEFVTKSLPAMFNAYVCGAWIRMDTNEFLAMVGDHLLHPSNSRLTMTIDALDRWIAGNPSVPPGVGMSKLDCRGLLEALRTLRTALELFASARDWITSRMEDPSRAWEDFGFIALFLAELLRTRAIARAIAEAVGVNEPPAVRADRIGAMYGVLIGMIVWEVIEEVLTAGIGKGARLVRFIP